MGWYYGFKPYVSVAKKRARALKTIASLQKKGQKLSPVTIEGNKIARTFWGKAWCDNLESYSDFENRLPRGRSYLRNGSVVDLQIAPGKVTALVNGSELYKVQIDMKSVKPDCWSCIRRECAGQIGSLIELLQGKLSNSVMGVITRPDGGLFPKPPEIKKSCSCPDWADMCKHVAAVLYAVGARLDKEPELLFVLRQVDHLDLITQAGDLSAVTKGSAGVKTIAGDELADVFGIELERPADAAVEAGPAPAPATPSRGGRKVAGQKPSRAKAAAKTKAKGRGETADRSAKSRPSRKSAAKRGHGAGDSRRKGRLLRQV
jgi:uncharacterized Zn finger protein